MLSFREVNIDDAAKILNWRTSSQVERFMTTDLIVDLRSQEEWVGSCYSTIDYYHWIIVIDHYDVGLLSVKDINLEEKSISWGFYVAESKFRGFGAMVPPFFYNFVFATWGIREIYVEVFEGNLKVLSMHSLHGYVRRPELDRLIDKNGISSKLLALSLSSEVWFNKNKFQKMVTHFPISKWLASPFVV